MRTIKFRIWNLSEKKMYSSVQSSLDTRGLKQNITIWDDGRWDFYSVINNSEVKIINSHNLITIDDYNWEYQDAGNVLMQFVGERDTNYKDIYEGDLVRLDKTFNGKDENSEVFEVVYLDEDNADEYPTFPDTCTYILFNRETKNWIDFQWDDTDYMTVIGNIYEGVKE
jgi:uncharacterized phage protein (TIGR01671 family)